MKAAVQVGLCAVVVVAAILGSYFLSLYEVSASNQRWCDTLNVLTATVVQQPSDPSANPSREASYKLYTDFTRLKREFGC